MLPSGINSLNYSNFCNPKVRATGGHTFLPSEEKGRYTLITDGGGHHEEVMRIGLALRPLSKPSPTVTKWKDTHFDQIEKTLLENYHTRKSNERLFTAMVLAAKFINQKSKCAQANCYNDELIRGMEGAKGLNVLHCHGGIMLHVLACLQLALLEEWNTSVQAEVSYDAVPRYSVSASLETYGGKSRGEQSAVSLDSVDDCPSLGEKAEELAAAIGPKAHWLGLGLETRDFDDSGFRVFRLFDPYLSALIT